MLCRPSGALSHSFLRAAPLCRWFSAEKQFRIDYVENGHTALLKLANPAKKNALSKDLLDDMNSALDELNKNTQVRSAILMSSEPGMFCSGADLKQRLSFTNEQVVETVKNLRRTFHRVYKVAVPVVALVDGPALGGGLELALACDLRVSTKTAKLGLPEVGLAIIPGWDAVQQPRDSAFQTGPNWEYGAIPQCLLMDLPFRETRQIKVKIYKQHMFGMNEPSADDSGDPPHVVCYDSSGARTVHGQYRELSSHMLRVTWTHLTKHLGVELDSEVWTDGLEVLVIGQLEYDGYFYFDEISKLQ